MCWVLDQFGGEGFWRRVLIWLDVSFKHIIKIFIRFETSLFLLERDIFLLVRVVGCETLSQLIEMLILRVHPTGLERHTAILMTLHALRGHRLGKTLFPLPLLYRSYHLLQLLNLLLQGINLCLRRILILLTLLIQGLVVGHIIHQPPIYLLLFFYRLLRFFQFTA